MKREVTDKERLMEVRRKKMLLGISAVIVVVTIIICVALSRLAVSNVDTKKGLAQLKKLEETDISEAEAAIDALEAQEQDRPLTEKFANAVIIGDSRVSGFTGYEVLEASSVSAKVGAKLTDSEDLIETAVDLKPSAIFIAYGLNDITDVNGDKDALKDRFLAFINTLRKQLPEAKIYVDSILPVRSDVLEEKPEYKEIGACNEALKELCEEEKISFVDASDLMQEEYYESDGEHMTAEFYPLWGERMAEVAGL